MLALSRPLSPQDTGGTRSLHRRVLGIAVPMILSNLTIPLLGMVDTAVVGHLDSPIYLGAVAVGGTLFNVIYMGLNFLRMGTTGVTAQAHGRGDGSAMRDALGRSLLLASGLAAILLLLQWPIRSLGLSLIGADHGVSAAAATYFDIRIWAAPAVLADYVLLGWFLGLQDARAPLAMMATINGVNMALDVALVIGMGMDVDGVALASVIAEYAGLVLALALARRRLRENPGAWHAGVLLTWSGFGDLATINANIFVRTICLVGSFAFFTAQAARFGEVILAANAILLSLQSTMAYGLDGFAHAAEALVGRAIGQGNRSLFRASVKACAIWSAGIALVFSLLYATGGRPLIGLLTDLAAVRAATLTYLPWMVLSPLLSVWAFLLDGIFIGATRAREMRNNMLAAVLLVYIPAWYLLRGFGNHGLWAALMLFLAARGAGLGLSFARIERSAGFVAA